MKYYKIQGGKQLNGEVTIHGSKNSVLPILAASLLSSGEITLHNCPKLSDVKATLDILKLLGCQVKQEGRTIIIQPSSLIQNDIPCELMEEMRSSVLFLGALLARSKEAKLCSPGGCQLGPRPIDFHVNALKDLGIEIIEKGDFLHCQTTPASCGKEIYLPFPSVGATENIMITACGLPGTTVIIGAAREPEIIDLQNFLLSMGASISGGGTSTISIEGGRPLHGTEYSVMSDRVVACTYLSAAAITGGAIRLNEISPATLTSVLTIFQQMGCEIETSSSAISVNAPARLKAVSPLRTAPYPGFPTDTQALLMATLTQSLGSTMFVENMFDSRYHHVDDLRRMGADIEISGRVALVTGKTLLHGATTQGRDLRGTAALILAALCAEGESHVFGLSHLNRGYEPLEHILNAMGGSIQCYEK